MHGGQEFKGVGQEFQGCGPILKVGARNLKEMARL